MNIFGIIKELYNGKENLVAQVGIFSLAGIMAIAFNEVISVFTGNTFLSVFITPSVAEVIIFALLGITIFIYLTGYMYRFVHENFQSEYTELPSISMNCFVTFLKTFPVMFVWGLYIGIALILGHLFLNVGRVEFFVFFTFLLVLFPFINMVFLLFAREFQYEKKLFNPLIIIKIMKKTFVSVFVFLIQFIGLGIILSFINGFLFQIILYENTRNVQMALILLLMSISSYIQQVLNLAYYKGLTEVIKKEPNITA